MRKIFLIFILLLFNLPTFASDEKPGRYFEDQPDVNDDFQIHFIYFYLIIECSAVLPLLIKGHECMTPDTTFFQISSTYTQFKCKKL